MANITPRCDIPTHHLGSMSYYDESCYYPGSNCFLTDKQCVSIYKDTGCEGGDAQYACAQTIYLKQQIQVQKQAQPVVSTDTNQGNVELKTQLQAMEKQIEILQSKQATVTATSVPPAHLTPLLNNPIVPYSLLGILILGIVVLMKMKIITLTSKS